MIPWMCRMPTKWAQEAALDWHCYKSALILSIFRHQSKTANVPGATLLFTLEANGTREFDCSTGKPKDTGRAVANYNGDGYTGYFYYNASNIFSSMSWGAPMVRPPSSAPRLLTFPSLLRLRDRHLGWGVRLWAAAGLDLRQISWLAPRQAGALWPLVHLARVRWMWVKHFVTPCLYAFFVVQWYRKNQEE